MSKEVIGLIGVGAVAVIGVTVIGVVKKSATRAKGIWANKFKGMEMMNGIYN